MVNFILLPTFDPCHSSKQSFPLGAAILGHGKEQQLVLFQNDRSNPIFVVLKHIVGSIQGSTVWNGRIGIAWARVHFGLR